MATHGGARPRIQVGSKIRVRMPTYNQRQFFSGYDWADGTVQSVTPAFLTVLLYNSSQVVRVEKHPLVWQWPG